jgi:hypothetical protein
MGNDILMRRKVIVGQSFPVGKLQYREIAVGITAQKKFELGMDSFCLARVFRDYQRKALVIAGGIGQCKAAKY